MNSIKYSLLILGLLLTTSSGLSSTISRRRYLQWQTGGCIAAASIAALSNPSVAQATNLKSRTDGYAVQYIEREWAYILSGAQYNILRKGGTERQKSSILNTYTPANVGTYVCAGCNTPLFTSADKFSSGTGWPSFSTALQGVEEEDNITEILKYV